MNASLGLFEFGGGCGVVWLFCEREIEWRRLLVFPLCTCL